MHGRNWPRISTLLMESMPKSASRSRSGLSISWGYPVRSLTISSSRDINSSRPKEASALEEDVTTACGELSEVTGVSVGICSGNDSWDVIFCCCREEGT